MAFNQGPTTLTQLSKCLKQLATARSDEEKLGALIILPRLLDPTNERAVHLTFTRMNFRFLVRLLQSDCSEIRGQVTESALSGQACQSIALNIISCFCTFPDLCKSTEVLELLPTLVRVLQESSETASDILHCILCISEASSSISLLDEKLIVALCQKLDMERLNTEADAVSASNLACRCLYSVFSRGTAAVHDSEMYFENRGHVIEYQIALIRAAKIAIQSVAQVIKLSKTKLKFDGLRLALDILHLMISEDEDPVEQQWGMDVRDGLALILGSKLSPTIRDNALMVASLTYQYYGENWLFAPAPGGEGQNPPLHKFAALLIHLTCAEIRVRLDSDFSATVSAPSIENTGVGQERNENRGYDSVLAACLRLLELSVRAIAALSVEGNEAPAFSISPDMFLSMRAAMSEAFLAIMANMVDRWMKAEELTQEGHRTAWAELMEDDVALLALRAVATWLGEDTEIVGSPEVRALVPLLVRYAKARIRVNKIRPIEFLGPAFTSITSDAKSLDSFMVHGGIPVILNAMRSPSNISKEPSEEFLRFQTSLLCILLNVTVVAPTALPHDPSFETFSSLLIYEYLPFVDTAENCSAVVTIFAATTVALALFALRGAGTSVSMALFEAVSRSALIFLARSRNLRVENEVVWDEVSELWYLSVNCLADILTNFPHRARIVMGQAVPLSRFVASTCDTNTWSESDRQCIPRLFKQIGHDF
ncbi:Neurochondrin-domain-containing protein [Zopfochytrium polystomum]|nr:Neurochondrin-domain-containing protein [Zopfochytrium polystomum]